MRASLLLIPLLLAGAAGCGGGDAPGGGASDAPDGSTDAVVPFTIDVPDAVLDDLQARLADARFPDQLEGAGWTYGSDLDYMRELTAYWREEYDWREQERALNRFDHFKTDIDGLDIHFIHQRSPNPDALPLMIIHGWPGSFVEFHKIIEPLTDPAGSWRRSRRMRSTWSSRRYRASASRTGRARRATVRGRWRRSSSS